ncbi:hypothetical protein [Candidatus Methylomirabilis sp.]|uniref:DUF4398 domain-containing protein n=1 Tax=Candidatus Methylomirabilis tolerans TaxID=3123416 RepID=A0AAJ1AI48_9BACT|nr:hypothetical protein [Candidatus Methylomirabilis sp.]
MRISGRAVRQPLALTVISVVTLLWSCSGVHLRSESYDWVAGERTAPAAVTAAQVALAEAKTKGASNIKAARYQMARAQEYLVLAERELFERDLATAEMAAGIARKAAEEAKAIAQRGK